MKGLQKMKIEDVGGQETLIPGTPHNPFTPIADLGQGLKDWEGTDHPYYELHDLFDEAQWMLDKRRRQITVAN
jgi:hypothetical protein